MKNSPLVLVFEAVHDIVVVLAHVCHVLQLVNMLAHLELVL